MYDVVDSGREDGGQTEGEKLHFKMRAISSRCIDWCFLNRNAVQTHIYVFCTASSQNRKARHEKGGKLLFENSNLPLQGGKCVIDPATVSYTHLTLPTICSV